MKFSQPPPLSTVFQYLLQIRQMHSTFLQTLSLKFALILPSKARLTSGFQIKILCAFLIYPIHDTRTAHPIILDLINPTIVTDENTVRYLLIMHIFLFHSHPSCN
jgi:hypothetical protein